MIAFICNSPVQIIRAIHMKTINKELSESADVFIADTFTNAEIVADRIRDLHIFNDVVIYSPKLLERKASVYRLMHEKSDLSKKIRCNNYDKLVSFNLEGFLLDAIYNLNCKNDRFTYYCVEDAPGIYKMYMPPQISHFSLSGIIGNKKPFYNVDKWFFSMPDLVYLPINNQVVEQLEPIDISDRKFVDSINYIFDFDPESQEIDADVLIMEEPFFTDGRMIQNYDYEIYNKIRNDFPGLKIMVKNHPRTKNNRFIENFNILPASNVPWEVFLLNGLGKSSFPIQIGIVCSTLQSDMLMFRGEGRKISLAPMFFDKLQKRIDGTVEANEEIVETFNKIRSYYKNPDLFRIVSNQEELQDSIRQLIKER